LKKILFCLLLALGANAQALKVVRGPYLQLGTPTSMVLKWRTDKASASEVRFGTDKSRLDRSKRLSSRVKNHEVSLTGLKPDTRYWYQVGDGAQVLAGPGEGFYFDTYPAPGQVKPAHIWVVGDAGTKGCAQREVRDAYAAWSTEPTSLVLQLGDNAYGAGEDSEYQKAMFEGMYEAALAHTVFWSCIGNHETYGAKPYAYWSIYSFPTRGEAGGVPSGSKAYYSFDYSNIHFIDLDSMESSRQVGGAMYQWLQADLKADKADWTIAFWHHPPYTKGTHDSDTEIELIEMRQNFLPLLEAAGVDLVLSGHSHVYERSSFVDGYYGKSQDWDNRFIKQPGFGREEQGGAYHKASLGQLPHAGAVYVVTGSSGQAGGGPLNHPVHCVSLNVLGSLVLDVDHGRLDAVMLDNHGGVRDNFTLLKGRQNPSPAQAAAVKDRAVRIKNARVAPAVKEKMRFDFEDGDESWAVNGKSLTLKPSLAQAWHGKQSLELEMTNTTNAKTDDYVKVRDHLSTIKAGSALTFHVFMPSDKSFSGLEPYISDGAGNWIGTYAGEYSPGWNAFQVNVPCDAKLPLVEAGVYFFTEKAGKAKAYLDAVTDSE
jgi:hypothetical protein